MRGGEQRGGVVRGIDRPDSHRRADHVIIAVPYDKLGEVFRGLGSSVDDKVVIDATNRVNTQNPGEVLGTASNAEEIQKRHPKVRVVKAFNYAFASRMADPTVDGVRLDGFVASDDQAAKDKALELVESIGFRPIDAGPLVMARALEAMALLNVTLRFATTGRGRTAGSLSSRRRK